jgi:hypothetical protein
MDNAATFFMIITSAYPQCTLAVKALSLIDVRQVRSGETLIFVFDIGDIDSPPISVASHER